LGKLRAFGYGPTASITSGQMTKVLIELEWNSKHSGYINWKQLGKVHQPNQICIWHSFIQLWVTSNSHIQSWAI